MSIIDSGGFGKIYVVRDHDRTYVIKKGQRRDMRAEYEIYKRVQDIPGIPKAYDYWSEGRCGYLRLEQLGLSLRRLARLNRLHVGTVINWGLQLLDIVVALHQRGIVHRDIKPDNMVCGLRENSSRIYLVDFGLATHHRKYAEGLEFCGTPGYTSPYVNRGIRPSYRDDMESLGLSLFYLLHRPLPKAPNEMHDHREFNAWIRYCRRLDYGELPDPAVLRDLLEQIRQNWRKQAQNVPTL